MKVAVSSIGQTIDSPMDPRFGRAAYFLVVDSETMQFSVIDNIARSASGGAGIAAAQAVIDAKSDAVITGQLGPNALNVLSDAGLELYQGIDSTVFDKMVRLNQNKLARIKSSGPAHQGMSGMGGHQHHGGHGHQDNQS